MMMTMETAQWVGDAMMMMMMMMVTVMMMMARLGWVMPETTMRTS